MPDPQLSMGQYLVELQQASPDEVLFIDKEVDLRYGLTALFLQLERERRYPVIVAEKPVFDGHRYELPVVTGLYSSRVRLADLLGADPYHVGPAFAARMARPVQPQVVDRAEAPVKQVVVGEREVDLLEQLPAPWHHPMDPGQYLSAAFFTTYARGTTVENSAIQRGWVCGKREIRVFMQATSHNYHNFEEYEALGEPMPVAFWIGHHPLHVMGCETRGRLDHWEASGAVAQRPLRLVASETLGDGFLVPADAEIVIEGFLLPGERRPEGPFGEYPQYYGPQHHNPVMEVSAVTRRHQAMLDTVMVGHTHWLAGFQREGNAYDHIRRTVRQVRNVYLPQSGCQAFHIYVQIQATGPGQARSALLAALTIDPLIKHAFVFDDDVDIFDEREVLWAIATRFQGDKDILTVPGVLGPSLDPSSLGSALGCKTGFDCTRGVPESTYAKRLVVDGEVLSRADLADYVAPEVLQRIPQEMFA